MDLSLMSEYYKLTCSVGVVDFGNGVVDIGKGIGNGVVDIGKKIGDGVVNVGKTIGDGVGKAIDGIKDLGNKLKDFGSGIGKAFGSLFGSELNGNYLQQLIYVFEDLPQNENPQFAKSCQIFAACDISYKTVQSLLLQDERFFSK